MKRLALAGLFCLLAARAFAVCPTTTLTFKDAGGVTQTLCFGGASGAFIPQYQILDSAGTNALGINASGQIGISNFPATQPVSGTVTANQGTSPWVDNITQFGGVNLSTGTGASGTGIPRVTVSNDSSLAANQSVNLSQVGGNTTAQGGVTGSLLVEQGCAGQTVANTSIATINLASTTGTTIVTGVASKKTYICSINIVAGAAVNVALVEGTTATCATGITGMAGGATAATGWNLAANGGLTLGNGQGLVFKTATAADNVCLLASAASQLSGSLTYAQF